MATAGSEVQDDVVDHEAPAADDGPAAADDAGEKVTVGTEDKTPSDRPADPDRRTRRANAMKEERAKREAAEADTARMRQEIAEARREAAEIRGRLEEREKRERDSQPSPHREKLKNMRSQWEMHAANAANPKLDAESRRKAIDAAHELEYEMQRVTYQALREEEQRNAPPDDSERVRAAEKEQAWLENKFQWLEGNDEAHGYAISKFRSLVASGRPSNRATMVEACTFIAKKFGFGGTETRDNGNSRRFAMVPGGDAEGDEAPRGYQLKSKNDVIAAEKLAMKLYPKLSKEDAVKKYTKEFLSDS